MMAALILVFSLATLGMFFVSYCRSLVAACSQYSLSAEVRDVTGIRATAEADDYARVVQVLQLCPDRAEDRTNLHAVGLYHSLLTLVQNTAAQLAPSLRNWAERERAHCAQFAAVTLDRRIAFSREMLARQSEL
jgi:hypothetical protein